MKMSLESEKMAINSVTEEIKEKTSENSREGKKSRINTILKAFQETGFSNNVKDKKVEARKAVYIVRKRGSLTVVLTVSDIALIGLLKS